MENGLWLTYAILAAALVGSIMFSMEKPVELRFFSIWRVFALDVPRCPACGGRLRLIAELYRSRIHSALSAQRRATDPVATA